MFIQGATCDKEILLNNVFICWCQSLFMMLLGRVLLLDSDKMQSEGVLRNITFLAIKCLLQQ